MNKLRSSLSLQMVIATLLGIFSGLFFGDYLKVFKPWTDIYIMILKITILPYLIAAIIHGIGQLSSSQAKEILKKGAIFVGLAWAVNIAMVYLVYFCFPKVKGKVTSNFMSSPHSSLNIGELLIPENIFSALSNNMVPAIVIFSVLLGISFMCIKEKQSAMSILQTIVDALTKLTTWISKITPLGTFMIIAYQVGTMDLLTVQQVITYIIFYIIAVCLIVFWIFPRLTAMLTHLNAMQWLKDLLPILLLAYTTNVVIVCLPFIMQLVQRETLFLLPNDEKAQNQIQGTVSVIFNIPLGSIFMALFIFFCAIFYHTPLSILNQLKLFLTTFLTGIGSVGIGSAINSLTFIVDAMSLPQDAINLFLITVPFTSGFQSMLSAMEITTIALFITFACRKLIRFKWPKLLQNLLVTFTPVILIFGILYLYNPFPPIQNTTKSIYEIGINSVQNVKTYKAKIDVPPVDIVAGEDSFDRILRTKILRVGYYPDVPPFSFYNDENNLTGYDIYFAYLLANDLNCKLELVPLDYTTITQDLENNYYDIGMSAITLNEERLKKVSFTESYDKSKFVFINKGPVRREHTVLENIKKDPDLQIAVLKGTSYEMVVKTLLGQKKLWLLDSYEEFGKNATPNDLLLWTEAQSIGWMGKHPGFHIIYPSTSMGYELLAYPINDNAGRFLTFLNLWLQLKRSEGVTDEQYKLWVYGKTNLANSGDNRWSILRNVFHFHLNKELGSRK